MSWRRSLIGFTLILLTAAGGFWLYLRQDPVLMVTLYVRLFMPKPEPNRPVAWTPGPQEAATAPAQRKPNIIIILADDLGFNDISLMGGGVAGGLVKTPAIDALGQDGVILTRGYSGNATCAPSRAAIMTGRFATRFGFEFTPTPKSFAKNIAVSGREGRSREVIYHGDREKDHPPAELMGLPASEVTLPELLKGKGYHNLMLGKWHLGEAKGMMPHERGFHNALGFMPGAAMFLPENDPNVVNSKQDFDPIDKYLWAVLPFQIRFNGGPNFKPKTYMTDYLGDEAVRAIEANKNRPFFMYLAFNAPHTPLQALKEDYDALAAISDHRLRVYGAMIRSLDRNVAKVMAALRAHGLDENTLVIFTTDNGGASYIGLPEINRPYRGWKATFFEGGIHVPYLMRWPARLKAGTVFDTPAGHVDVYATAAAAAGADLPSDRIIDGQNLIALAQMAPDARPERTLYWRSGDYKVLLKGDWKLQVAARPGKAWLFNLKDDPAEQTNLAERESETLKAMTGALNTMDAAQAKPLWPSLIESPVAIDKPLSAPVTLEDEYVYWAN